MEVIVYGKVIDGNYSRVLFDNLNLDIETVFFIDRIQKHKEISKEAAKLLRMLGVIEGKMPNVYISAKIAESIDEKAQYVKNKAFDEKYYRNLVIEYLKQFKKASRDDIRQLLMSKLPDVLDNKQKENKIRNLLYSMGNSGIIERDGANYICIYVLHNFMEDF